MSNQGYFDTYDSLMQRYERDKKDQVARMNRSVPLVHVEGLPLNYTMWGFAYEPLEYTNWMDESISWKETCYLGDWSQMPKYFLKGPDAEKFLSRLCINSFENFRIGQAKHGVICRENGNVAWEGIIWKYGEGDFYLTSARDPWIVKNLESGGYDATWQTVSNDYFIWMVQGPTSLFALEKACGESLRDIKFSHFRKAKINGKEVVIGRTGMGGGLGYEIHGPMKIALDIHKYVFDAGQEFGMKRLGALVKMIGHTENCFPTNRFHYLPDIRDLNPEAFDLAFINNPANIATKGNKKYLGSYEHSDLREFYRTPVDLGWIRYCKWDHDFFGREALEKEAKNPKRKMVTLVWNGEDCVEVFASLFKKGEHYKWFEFPRPVNFLLAFPDNVLNDGKLLGMSVGRVYSYYFREMISLCSIDIDYSAPDTEVTIIWGEPGTKQKEIRATVAPAPYQKDTRNVDVNTLPYYL